MTYYDILEISEDASLEVIKAAYKALAKKYHPDNYKGSLTNAEEKMAIINEAYQVLSDERQRTAYDKTIKTKSSTSTDNQTSHSYNCNTQHNNVNNQKDYYSEEQNSKQSQEGESNGIKKFLKKVGKGIINNLQENAKEIDNAFIDGMSMDEYTLVRKFKNSKGFKRTGYAKALESKGLLERNSEGKLVPTYRFKYYS